MNPARHALFLAPRAVRILLALVLATAAGLTVAAHATPVLDARYPGGNIAVVKVEGDTYVLKPDLRDTKKGHWWFYYNFRVRGAAGRTLHFRFTGQNPIGVRGPALSRDGGLSWRWMGAAAVSTLNEPKAWQFSFNFTDDKEVRFAYAIPYQQSHLERYLARHRGNSHLVIGELCRSRKGRAVECLRLGKITGEPKWRVLLTARHHACESLADYVMEGILESVLTDTTDGRAWREQIEVMAIPFMDKDGVEDGDQGKNRAPRDHNRDYSGQSIYPEVAAVREQGPAWVKGKPVFALDLHCPYIRGDYNEFAYFVGGPQQDIWAKVVEFSRVLEATQLGPIPYRTANNLPYGKAWNTASNTTDGKSFGSWARELPGVIFASTLEFPYANASDSEVTADSARAFGRDVARAILQYLTQGEVTTKNPQNAKR